MATFVELMQTSLPLTVALAGLLGLLVGSFLNVVIYRLPLMLQREWRNQCLEFCRLMPKKPGLPTRRPVTKRSTC